MKDLNKGFDIDKLKNDYISDSQNKVIEKVLFNANINQLIVERGMSNPEIFDIEVRTHGVTDQRNTGRCWIFSYLNYLREVIINKHDICENFELSCNYLSFYDKLERMNFAINRLIQYKDVNSRKNSIIGILSKGINDFGNFTTLADLISKYGIVPANIYEESNASSNTGQVNVILNRLLHKFNSELMNIKDINKINNLKEKYLSDVYKTLSLFYGMPPEKFSYKYRKSNGQIGEINSTPLEFYKSLGIDVKNDYISVSSSKSSDIQYNKLYTDLYSSHIEGGTDTKHLNLKMNNVKKIIIKQLKNNTPVCFSTKTLSGNVLGKWIDTYEPYSDILGIDLVLERNDIINNYDECSGNHSMLITGVKLDNNKPVAWKVENSWGSKEGFGGNFTLDDDFFTKYFKSAIIEKDFLSKKEMEITRKKSIKTKYWR